MSDDSIPSFGVNVLQTAEALCVLPGGLTHRAHGWHQYGVQEGTHSVDIRCSMQQAIPCP